MPSFNNFHVDARIGSNDSYLLACREFNYNGVKQFLTRAHRIVAAHVSFYAPFYFDYYARNYSFCQLAS